MRVHPPSRRKPKIKITERHYSVLRSDWSRVKLVIFILEMDQSENRTWHLTRKSYEKIKISDTNRDKPTKNKNEKLNKMRRSWIFLSQCMIIKTLINRINSKITFIMTFHNVLSDFYIFNKSWFLIILESQHWFL